jgi:prepilin-type processing-associated H-X9-DG protein
VLLFEIDSGWNISGVGDRMIAWPRHSGQFCVLMVDGHVETCDATKLKSFRWNP